MRSAEAVREFRRVEVDGAEFFVRAFSMNLGDTVVVEVVERDLPRWSHHTLSNEGDEWFGKVTTRDLPAALDALPARSDERIKAVTEWRDGLCALSARAIEAAFPGLSAKASAKSRGGASLDLTHEAFRSVAAVAA